MCKNTLQQVIGLNDMDKISYLDAHARYLDIDMIQYDYGFSENQAFFQKNKNIIIQKNVQIAVLLIELIASHQH